MFIIFHAKTKKGLDKIGQTGRKWPRITHRILFIPKKYVVSAGFVKKFYNAELWGTASNGVE